MVNLDRADLLVEIATKALESYNFARYKRAMRLAKRCLVSAKELK